MTDHPITQCILASCLLTSYFWSEAIAVLSVTSQLVATGCGAIIGVVTLYRMYKGHNDRTQ